MRVRLIAKLILIYLVVGFFTPAWAYIDPGTGSMLFSVVLGMCATAYFVLHSLIINLKSSLFASRGLSKNNKPFVIYSEGSQYFSVFKPVIDEFERREIPVVYLTSSDNDPIFDEEYRFVTREFIGTGNKAYFKLAFLRADVCLMTTPHLDVLQLKRSKFVKHYAHIFHSIGISMDYHLFAIDYYDSVLCDGGYQIPLIREIERKRNLPAKELPVVGSTYMDYLASVIAGGGRPSRFYTGGDASVQRQSNDFTVLVAPSWGPDGLLRKFGKELLQNLAKSSYNIIVRPHPQSMNVEKDVVDSLMAEFKDCGNISWNFDVSNLEVLSKSDVLISDFSCVMFDYALLFNRPFIFVDTEMNIDIYDMSDLDETPWRYRVVREIGKELNRENLSDVNRIIEKIKNEIPLEVIAAAKDVAWQYRGESAVRVVDFLVEKQKEVSKC